jgi:hypothetical protein
LSDKAHSKTRTAEQDVRNHLDQVKARIEQRRAKLVLAQTPAGHPVAVAPSHKTELSARGTQPVNKVMDSGAWNA